MATNFSNWINLSKKNDLNNYLSLNGGTLNGKLTLQTDAWDQLDLKEKGNNDSVGKFRFCNNNNYPELHITLSTDNSNENRTFLKLRHNYDLDSLPVNAFEISKAVNGTYMTYNLYGEHNVSLLDSRYLKHNDGIYPNFSMTNTLCMIHSNITKGTPPSQNCWWTIAAIDNSKSFSNTTRLGQFEVTVTPNNEVSTEMRAYKPIANSSEAAQIKVGYDKDGNWYTYVPTPNVQDNSGKIITTQYINNKFKISTSDLIAESSSLTTGQFYFVYE